MTRGVPSSGPVSTELQVSIARGANGAAVCQVVTVKYGFYGVRPRTALNSFTETLGIFDFAPKTHLDSCGCAFLVTPT